ncbi:STAS domain-containing protein [Colwellia sp. BRX8-9]|uniref:STAS domain-containing protein n=1 Tax=Colwellia sp. BRX8-9 TaxID=2759831 RepID=UPI0015F5EF86|nr:STAS domain-containing protein [Colwellia sp. BRX8-9]MBA6349848.1 STAS domain-containing protein [Colwellia sp. BRX8-9]
MTVKTKVSKDNKEVSISVLERFDFAQHQCFRKAYSQYSQNGTKFIVDLSKTEYIDSSALGMILLLKDYAEHIDGTLTITKPSKAVSKILEIAQFHRLMTIVQ